MATPNPDDRSYEYHFQDASGDVIIYAPSLEEAKKSFKEEFPELKLANFAITRREPGNSKYGSPFDA